ncbi:oxidoreductase [candidate division KSB3 bacterium]|uniref:Oxidoreductase n=1 Tax=candidate division KSB3 bacterium TaxID=2044937 RepID=A0A2G6KBH8_9BACT|nr:MAG: oxidoreductase [candidate division KSB3 bacterium]
MKNIRWGIIGCGDVTEVKSGPAFQKIEGSQLVAVMRRNGGKAKDYAERHGVPTWYDDADTLIHDPNVDAVYIATPPSSHADYAIKVLEAGKPVYVEKPMAMDYAECKRMIAASEKANLPLFVAYYRRRLPAFLKVEELLEAGAIGDVRFMTIELYQPAEEGEQDPQNWHWHILPEFSAGGRFVDMGCHQLDILDYLFGPIDAAQGIAQNQAKLYPAEDIVCANFRFQTGVLGTGMWCFTISEESRRDQIEIIGSRGRITFSAFQAAPVRLDTAETVEEYEFPWPEHVAQPLIETVVAELQGRGTCPSTAVSAARTTRIVDHVLADWRQTLS